jgi:urease accessory protein UreF
MAAHMAQLLADSDLEELEEIVARWLKDAPNDSQRHQYRKFGDSLLALKRELVSKNSTPSREDLEVALTMMMELAAQKNLS